MAVYLEDGDPLIEVHNPVEQILKEATLRGFGSSSPQRIVGAVTGSVPLPTFETGVDDDGNDLDLFITEIDYTEDITRRTSP